MNRRWRWDTDGPHLAYTNEQMWGMANSQHMEWPRSPRAPIRMTDCRSIGEGWTTLGIAQSRCRWWIPGMMALLYEIADDRALELEKVRVHDEDRIYTNRITAVSDRRYGARDS